MYTLYLPAYIRKINKMYKIYMKINAKKVLHTKKKKQIGHQKTNTQKYTLTNLTKQQNHTTTQ